MWCCFCQSEQLPSVTIDARSGAAEYDEYYRVAQMTLNPKSRNNFVAKKLATEILELPIQPLNGESEKAKLFGKRQTQVEGYVDICWRLHGAQERAPLGPTRFMVSSTSDPDYDLVLGKHDCSQYGLVKPKKQWRGWGKKNQ